MKDLILCPHCGGAVEKYRNPLLTVDIIIELEGRGVVLIRRRNPPLGWAIPGGFVDYGESLERAAVREAGEETSLAVKLRYQLGAYSDPARDPRHHTVSVVYVADAEGSPRAGDDAGEIGVFHRHCLPYPLAFDHREILEDYFNQCGSAGHFRPSSQG